MNSDLYLQAINLAAGIFRHEPWLDLDEFMTLGMQIPGVKEPWFCSLTGSLGDHLALTFYRGNESLRRYRQMCDFVPDPERPGQSAAMAQNILLSSWIAISVETGDSLLPEEKKINKLLGIKIRKDRPCIVLRSQEPAHAPEMVSEEELHPLIVAMKAFETAYGHQMETGSEHVDFFDEIDSESVPMISVTEKDENVFIQKVGFKKVNQSPLPDVTLKIPSEKAVELANSGLPKGEPLVVSMRFLPLPIPPHEKSKKFCYPGLLLVFNQSDFTALEPHMLMPVPTLQNAWESVCDKLCESILQKVKKMPETIYYDDPLLEILLGPLREKCGIKIEPFDSPQDIDDLVEALMGSMLMGMPR